MRCIKILLSAVVLLFSFGCGAANSSSPDSAGVSRLSYLTAVAQPGDDALQVDSEPLMPALPNPERCNPFEVCTEESDSAEHLTIQLKGFVDRGQMKAVLLVGDAFVVVREQEVIGGATIVSIRPPELVYEHDGTEHQLSL